MSSLERVVDDLKTFDIRGRPLTAPAAPPLSPLDGEDPTLRRPPHSVEAEQSLLGGLLFDPAAFGKVCDLVTAADFFSHAHRLVFSAIEALITEAAPVDVVSVFERLERDGNGDKAQGLVYLNQLLQAVPSTANITRYAEIVRERATLRSTIATLDEITTRAFRNEPAAAILDDAKVALGKIADSRKLGSRRVPLLGLDELREHARAVPWLIKHVLPASSIGMLYGGSGTFKSFIAIDCALHIAHGLPWMGRRTHQGSVLYIAAEGGAGLWARIVAWHRARRLQWAQTPLHVVPAALDLTQDAWRVVEAAQAKGVTPSLVVVDTLSQTYSGEENSANEVAAYFRELGTRFRELWGCAVLILHHSGHNATERPRGSSAMRANLDFMFGVFRDEKEMLATMTCAKQKDGESFQDTAFAVSVHELGKDEDGDPVTSLVARHVSDVEELQEVMAGEKKAGRGGANQLLLSLLQNGQLESELRQVFYRECGQETAEARKKAYQRARSWLMSNGLMEVSEGFVLVLKAGQTK
jgi:hypothetical protein